MIGRDIVKLLESECKRRPHIKLLYDRAETLTDEEIEAAQVPLKWFKDALKEARERKKASLIIQQLREISDLQPLTSIDTSINSVTGIVGVYTGENFWATTITGGLFEVKFDDFIFFPIDGGVWINQVFLNPIPNNFRSYQKVKDDTRAQYIEEYAERLAKKY